MGTVGPTLLQPQWKPWVNLISCTVKSFLNQLRKPTLFFQKAIWGTNLLILYWCVYVVIGLDNPNKFWVGGAGSILAVLLSINLSIYLSSIYLLSSSGVFIRASFTFRGFPCGSDGKTFACNAGDPGSIPGSGRSPGEGNGNPLQYSCLENSIDWEAW